MQCPRQQQEREKSLISGALGHRIVEDQRNVFEEVSFAVKSVLADINTRGCVYKHTGQGCGPVHTLSKRLSSPVLLMSLRLHPHKARIMVFAPAIVSSIECRGIREERK